MKLEVGMYVRTKDGYVSQYRYYDTTNMGKLLCIPLSNRTFANIEDIIKASHNIIDLIEVGDYVNGLKVIDIVENDIYISDYYAESYIGIVKVKDIKDKFVRIK